jgi:RNA polymerase sigma-70 factor (ECF subfamily)
LNLPFFNRSEDEARRDTVERLKQRDESALEEIYERTSGKAFGLAYRITGEGPAAEDVLQEVYAWIWDNSTRLNPERGSVDSLIMTMIHRRSIDVVRSRSRRNRIVNESTVQPGFDEVVDVYQHVEASLDAVAVRSAMEGLPAEQKTVVELAYFGGLTHAEIAESEDLPLGTVKSRIRLAMSALRNALGAGGVA